ncbi:MAG: hypothetical protein H7321_06490 [Bacteroidia bacterium]|nr:hypothetical protein [Bacteroidia bacterium]
MKYFFVLLFLGVVINANAQHRYRITALEGGTRYNNEFVRNHPSLSTIQDNAKMPVSFSGEGYIISSQGFQQDISSGIYLHLSRFINDTTFNPNRKLRIGISGSSAGIGVYGKKQSGNIIDTFSEARLSYVHSYNILSLDIATLHFGKIFWKRFRPFAGAGISPGISLNSKGRFSSDTTNSTSFIFNGRRYYDFSISTSDREYALKPLIYLSAYIPIGLNFRVSKTLDLNLESRLNINITHIKTTEFNTGFSVMLSATYKLF